MANIYDKIPKDAQVKLTDMFDNNFREQGFFGKKWTATKVSKVNKAVKKGSILIVTGALRRSICRIAYSSVAGSSARISSGTASQRRYTDTSLALSTAVHVIDEDVRSVMM